MISGNKFIQQSLELHLFFTRIMMEHSFFLEVGFTPKDANYILKANAFKMEFDRLLRDVISISNGIISLSVLKSGEIITPYTVKAEMATAHLTGVNIPTNLTVEEAKLKADSMSQNPVLEQKVSMINQRAMRLVDALIQFKTMILSDVSSCRIKTAYYPSLLDHIIREAKFYYHVTQRLQNREEVKLENEAVEYEIFWNDKMGEHAEFIRGLLDPQEKSLIKIANDLANEFDELENEAKKVIDKIVPISKLTDDSLKVTTKIVKFKEQGTQGLIECKIKSIILPLLGDHTLREANHYMRLLKVFEKL